MGFLSENVNELVRLEKKMLKTDEDVWVSNYFWLEANCISLAGTYMLHHEYEVESNLISPSCYNEETVRSKYI